MIQNLFIWVNILMYQETSTCVKRNIMQMSDSLPNKINFHVKIIVRTISVNHFNDETQLKY